MTNLGDTAKKAYIGHFDTGMDYEHDENLNQPDATEDKTDVGATCN
ncbi:MAG: hypothetical protein ACI9DH_001421 [Halioglobus sp.]